MELLLRRVGFVATCAAGARALGGVALAQDIGLGPFWLTPDRPVVTAVQADQAAVFAVFQRGARAASHHRHRRSGGFPVGRRF